MSSTHRPSRPARRNTASNRHDARVGAPEALRLRPTVLAMALHSVLIGGIGAGAATLSQQAHAQPSGANSAAATALPEGDAVKIFSIPAGPLDVALDRFARAAGVNFSYDAALVTGLNTQGLNGSFGTAAGLVRLLEGSGLEALAQPGGGYSLRKAAQAAVPVPATSAGQPVPTLATVKVTAQAERNEHTEGTGSYTTGRTNAATGLALSLRETPQSVSVMTRQRIDDQGLASMDDIVRQTVGVTTVQTGMANGTYIRGYQVSNFQVDGVSTTFQSFGTQSNMGFGSMDTAVYDSVAVVRGAAGLLTGAGDPSGSVSLIRKRPTRQFQASVEGSAGRWDQYRAVADAGGPLNEAGTLRGRFVGAYNEGKSWIDNYRGDKNVTYGVLEADITERTLLSLTLEHSEESTKGTSGNYTTGLPLVYADGTLTPFDRHSNKMPRWASWDSKRSTAALSLEHAFNDDWRVKLNYRHDKVDDWYKIVEAWGSFNQSHYFSGGFTNHRGDSQKTDSFGVVLNGGYTLLGRQHDLVAGFNGSFNQYIQKHKGGGIDEWGFSGLSVIDGVGIHVEPDWAGAPTVGVANTKTKQSGLYLATKLHVTDDLSAIIGGRWSNWKYDDPDQEFPDHRKFSGVFFPYAGVTYDLTKQVSAYASYTNIFQPQSARDINGSLLDPEEGKNYEIGLKGEWFGGRLNASISAFETRKDNLAVYDYDTTGPTGDPVARAEDGTKGRGWEWEVSGELMPGWQLQGGYTRFVLRDGKDQRMNTDVLPEHLFKLFTAYTPRNVPKLTLGGGVNWQSKTYRSTAQGALRDIYTQKAYAVANLMASYRFDDRLSLNVNLNNVFDKEYRTRVHLHMYGPERNLSATLKYRF